MSKATEPSPAAHSAAAWLLACDVPALRAVARVESGPLGAFLPSGEPVILYERHIFSRLTNGRFDGARMPGPDRDAAYAALSEPSAGVYGPVRVQHARLQAAAELNREAALRACSWGLFQIMGANHVPAGYPQLQRFVTAMYRSVDDHLRAFCMFIRADARLVDAIRSHDWAAFAYAYNGPQYARHGYDKRMAAAYAKEEEA